MQRMAAAQEQTNSLLAGLLKSLPLQQGPQAAVPRAGSSQVSSYLLVGVTAAAVASSLTVLVLRRQQR
jgi:hypothetical protein